jgi:hypothetical protein
MDFGPEIKPTEYGGCSHDDCPSYDGKRCRLTGLRPYGCEPAFRLLAAQGYEIKPPEGSRLCRCELELKKARAHAEAAEAAIGSLRRFVEIQAPGTRLDWVQWRSAYEDAVAALQAYEEAKR